MNARESLAADRDAEQAWNEAESLDVDDGARYLRAIAAELRAQRVYANYLEGRRDDTKSRERRKS